MAAVARRVGPSLSQGQDREVMLHTAEDLEAEAAGHDVQAESIERSQPG
jgi:hypothetical protein